MSVLAEMLHERGVDVDGSDREEGSKTERLRSLGITVEIGQQADNVRGADTWCTPAPSSPTTPKSSRRTSGASASCIAATSWRC
ncbi:hypothetical protein BBJK_02352 [Bifidobacterium bifidum LMG 13195]|uniref:Mur ligase N-terminal catalytic domain-containing protein n=1 Tax=Bifidobacterium bifidum LMG 13195 TaxID=1207542 RepID=A0A286TE27_BIFBI|nr:hypothetical protein BBJK_02352 [Bifidobacterium bifidum LMG 13195]